MIKHFKEIDKSIIKYPLKEVPPNDTKLDGLIEYVEYLKGSSENIINHLDYVCNRFNDFIKYVEFIRSSGTVDFDIWDKYKDDPEELYKIKRDIVINEIIDNK